MSTNIAFRNTVTDLIFLLIVAFVFQIAAWKSNLIAQLGMYGFLAWEFLGFLIAYYIGHVRNEFYRALRFFDSKEQQ